MALPKANVAFQEIVRWINGILIPAIESLLGGGVITPQQFGAIADGSSHPLSGFYGTLAAAQVDYPFATALTQEIDYCAVKQASNTVFGVDGSEHGDTNARLNKPLYFPAGIYVFGNDTWLVRNLSGGHIYGAGRRATKLTSNNTVFATDGLWYSRIEGIEFDKLTTTDDPCIDIDGNVPGHPYATRSVQGNTFYHCLFNGGGGLISMVICRQGFSSAQGENSFIECHWSNATVCYWQRGFNALSTIILRGDMQVFTTAIYLHAGSLNVYGMSFESTKGYEQILDTSFVAHGGFDIDCSASGVGERIIIEGCRSESLRFFRGSSAQTGVLLGDYQNAAVSDWVASSVYTANQVIIKSVSGVDKLFRVTTPGTSGASEPTWTTTGTVSDGSVVWTYTQFYVVDASDAGSLFLGGNRFDVGDIRAGRLLNASEPFTREIAANYIATLNDEFILVDTTSGNITITLPIATTERQGKRYYIKKATTDANTVIIGSDDGGFLDGDFFSTVIPGGSRGWIIVEQGGGGLVARRYYVIARSFGVAAPVEAKYIVQSGHGGLSAEQALDVLGTGLVKNTTGTGVLSIAVAGTDYQAALTQQSAIADSNGSQADDTRAVNALLSALRSRGTIAT